MLTQDLFHIFVVTYIPPLEEILFIAISFCNIRKVQKVAGISELVIVDDPAFEIGLLEDIPNEVRTDKPSPSRHKNACRRRKRQSGSLMIGLSFLVLAHYLFHFAQK